MEGLFAEYVPEGFCEVLASDGPRPQYQGLIGRLGALTPDDMATRAALIESILRRQGITFAVYGEKSGTSGRGRWTWCRGSSRPTSGSTSSAASPSG